MTWHNDPVWEFESMVSIRIKYGGFQEYFYVYANAGECITYKSIIEYLNTYTVHSNFHVNWI
jgi:hypothetical protein